MGFNKNDKNDKTPREYQHISALINRFPTTGGTWWHMVAHGGTVWRFTTVLESMFDYLDDIFTWRHRLPKARPSRSLEIIGNVRNWKTTWNRKK